jgi:uncharacterized protein (DUF2249 family)
MKRGQFQWEYLRQGPALWHVRISRIQPPPPPATAGNA